MSSLHVTWTNSMLTNLTFKMKKSSVDNKTYNMHVQKNKDNKKNSTNIHNRFNFCSPKFKQGHLTTEYLHVLKPMGNIFKKLTRLKILGILHLASNCIAVLLNNKYTCISKSCSRWLRMNISSYAKNIYTYMYIIYRFNHRLMPTCLSTSTGFWIDVSFWHTWFFPFQNYDKIGEESINNMVMLMY